jgi:hypothetical protein
MSGLLFFCLNIFVFIQILGMVLLNVKLLLDPVLFDITFILYSVFRIFSKNKIGLGQCLFILTVFFYSSFWVYTYFTLYSSISLFLLELKPLIYTLLTYIFFIVERSDHNFIRSRIAPTTFLVGYFISLVIQYASDVNIRGMRPFVLIENNFESIFVMVVLVRYFAIRFQLITYAVLIGSISSAVSSFFVSAFYNKNLLIFKIIVFPLVSLVILLIYLFFRDISFAAVDRVFFIYATFQDLEQRGLMGLVFGNLGNIELNVNAHTCEKLLFYDVLKSGLCTPVLTHLYWSRIFLNFGIFGITATLYMIVKIARISHFNFLVIGAVALNGLSVSGFASGIIALTMVSFLDRRKFNVFQGI